MYKNTVYRVIQNRLGSETVFIYLLMFGCNWNCNDQMYNQPKITYFVNS